MREIKFRAWHEGYTHPRKTEPKMLYDTKTGDCLKWKADSQPVILMQYTGLKDKNGKEIYEGDVCINHGKFFKGETGIIKISEYGLYVDREFNKQECNWVEYWGEWFEYEYQKSCVEVIGNIFENPELIPANVAQ